MRYAELLKEKIARQTGYDPEDVKLAGAPDALAEGQVAMDDTEPVETVAGPMDYLQSDQADFSG